MSKLLIVDDDIRLRKLVRTYGEVEHMNVMRPQMDLRHWKNCKMIISIS